MLITFSDARRYQFCAAVAAPSATTHGDSIRLYPDKYAIEVEQPVLGRLFERVAAGEPVMLPHAAILDGQRLWLIAAATQRELERAVEIVGHFLVPTYAEFANAESVPQRKAFQRGGPALQESGAIVYPAGYYSLRAPAHFTDTILRRLDMWMNLERRRPSLHKDARPTYRQLYDVFNSALAARNWAEAEQALDEIRRNNLSTGDNLAFLEIQLLAQQERWGDIWSREDYGELARLRVPAAVRAALLTAFYASVLLPLEAHQRWAAVLEAFGGARARLGLLMTGRFGLTQSPVLHVFAYQAVLDEDRLALDGLRQADSAGLDAAFFDALERLLPLAAEPTETVSAPDRATLPPLQRARLALSDADYDTALRASGAVPDPVDRALLLLQIAYVSADPSVADGALQAFRALPANVQEEQQRSSHQVPTFLLFAQDLTLTPDVGAHVPGASQPQPEDWLQWFALACQHPDDPTLAARLDHVVAVADERFWTPQIVGHLNDYLLQVVSTPGLFAASSIKDALRKLIDIFLQDTEFPRDDEAYADLYELLYMAIVQRRAVNQTISMQLLRFGEAMLRHAPGRRETVNQELHAWFATPIPAIENSLFDAFELLGEYGLPGALLADLYRSWATYILDLPTPRDRVSLQAWLVFGGWVGAEDYLLGRFREMLRRVVDESPADPIAELPSDYRIAIFTLRPTSGERARTLLLQRNGQLDIRVCCDEVLTEQAKALAQNSDLVVIVTTCISHALTYGIQPYVRGEPVYPASSGTTSIVRGVEERLHAISPG